MALNKNMSKKLREIELKIESIKNKIPQFLLLTTENEKSFSGISNGYQKVEKKVKANSDIEVYIFKLPYELKKTMFALSWLKRATSSQISRITGNNEKVEDSHLYRLERMGYLLKEEKENKIFFKFPEPIKKGVRIDR
jgi:hypothetical protein